jgi:tyrosine-protein phosphatase SIW14
MSRAIQVAAGSLIVLTFIASPIVLAVRQEAKTRNFRVVRPGVLYRSGQMTKDGLQGIINDYHIKTVISLRDGQSERDKAEEEFCKSEDINFVRILPSRWGDEGGCVPVEAGVRRFREIMSDPRNYPVLVHCFAGIHRAGSYCAVYRMEFEHWSNAQAIAEMKSCGYTNLDEELDILGFMEQYRPTWMPPAEAASLQPAPTEVKKIPKSCGKSRESRKHEKTKTRKQKQVSFSCFRLFVLS